MMSPATIAPGTLPKPPNVTTTKAVSASDSPTVGESLALTAFVVVTLGGFGSVPGAMLAGLLIGVIQSLSSYWLGPVYKDIIVYALFVAVLWVRPEGLFGKAA